MIDKTEIERKIAALESGAQRQLDKLANDDPVWTHIQGQLVAYREVLKSIEKKDGE